jgi:hypothetical protein
LSHAAAPSLCSRHSPIQFVPLESGRIIPQFTWMGTPPDFELGSTS